MAPIPSLLQCRLTALLLIICSLVCAPLSLLFTLHHYLYFNRFYSVQDILWHLDRRQIEANVRREGCEFKTILITGSRGIKSLALARAFKRLSPYHRVILADSKSWSIVSPIRFSASTDRHYFLPSASKQPEKYCESIIQILRSESVDHWIPCSGPATTIIDSEIAEEVRRLSGGRCCCWAPTKNLVEELHEKDKFMALCVQYGMQVPDCSGPLASVDEAMSFLFRETKPLESHGSQNGNSRDWSFILKPIEFVNDAGRIDFTMLPLGTREETEKHLLSKFRSKAAVSSSSSTSQPKGHFILQRFIRGQEYCTHASVDNNVVKSFVCCKGSDMVMRYEDVRRLPTHIQVSDLAEEWTKTFLSRLKAENRRFDGHFSIDFIFEESERRLYPIECNPRVHTAVTLFRSVAQDLAQSYLPKNNSGEIVRPSLDEPAHIWLAHSVPLSILNSMPPFIQNWLQLLHPNLTKDYFGSYYDHRFDPISFSPKPVETPIELIRSVLMRPSHPTNVEGSNARFYLNRPVSFIFPQSMSQLDPLWDPEYHSEDMLIWWMMGHVYWNWLLFYQVFVRNQRWSRVNVSTARIWEL